MRFIVEEVYHRVLENICFTEAENILTELKICYNICIMIVEDLLKEKGIKYQISGKDAKIHCLSPDHDDQKLQWRVIGITECFIVFPVVLRVTYFPILSLSLGQPASPLEVKIT